MLVSNEDIVERGLHQGLEVRKIPRIRGVGVFATATFCTGALLVRYSGQTLTHKEGNMRDKEYEMVSFARLHLKSLLLLTMFDAAGYQPTPRCNLLQQDVCR